MKSQNLIEISGRTGSGKTTLMLSIVAGMVNDFDKIFLLEPFDSILVKKYIQSQGLKGKSKIISSIESIDSNDEESCLVISDEFGVFCAKNSLSLDVGKIKLMKTMNRKSVAIICTQLSRY